jgi:ketosteroid isomerase-like protein
MSEENVELVKRAYEALAEHDPLGDWSWFLDEFAHDDLELRPAATGIDEGSSYKGREGWLQFWRDYSAAWDEVRYDPDSFEFFDAGDQVVAFVRVVGKGKASGIEVAQEEAHLWTVRDGKVLLGVAYVNRADALRDAGLSE